jgi:hypothetical protein
MPDSQNWLVWALLSAVFAAGELGLLFPGAQGGRGLEGRPGRQAQRGAGGAVRGNFFG